MPILKTKAIVLGSSNLGEEDKIVKFFTEDFGKISSVVKRARRIKGKYSGSIEPLNLVNLIYFEKENRSLTTINTCEILTSFHRVREDLERLKRGLYLIELIDLILKERQKSKSIFDLSVHFTSLIESSDIGHIDTLMRIFEIRILSLAGYKPRLEKCTRCNRSVRTSDYYRLSPLLGGIICSSCSENKGELLEISPGGLNFIKRALAMDLKRLSRLKLNSELNKELNRFMHTYMETHLGKSPKVYAFFDQ